MACVVKQRSIDGGWCIILVIVLSSDRTVRRTYRSILRHPKCIIQVCFTCTSLALAWFLQLSWWNYPIIHVWQFSVHMKIRCMHDTFVMLLQLFLDGCLLAACQMFYLYLTCALCLLDAHLIRFALCIHPTLSPSIFLRIRSNHKHLRRGWLSRCGPQVLCSQGKSLLYYSQYMHPWYICFPLWQRS